jgi:predicted acylesterase/phospholipase RssA
MARRNQSRPLPLVEDGKIDIVLGGGGIKGYAHIGFLNALAEMRVCVGDVTGVSIGSLVAAFYTNGYSTQQIDEILSGVLKQLDPKLLAKGMRSLGRPRNRADLTKLFEELCTTHKLVPKENLKIIAYNVRRRKPVVFEGTAYHLPSALAASCSVPFVMRPVWYAHDDQIRREHGDHRMVDGGVYHPHPTTFCRRRALVSKLGHARRLPREKLEAADFIYHLLEMGATLITDRIYDNNGENDIVVRTGLPCVASLNFHPSEKTCRAMVSYGYQKTVETLKQAIDRRLVPVSPAPEGTTSGDKATR